MIQIKVSVNQQKYTDISLFSYCTYAVPLVNKRKNDDSGVEILVEVYQEMLTTILEAFIS